MRSLVLDELTPNEAAAARGYLAARAEFSGVEGLYWLQLPTELLADKQIQAQAGGLPGAESYRLAVEAGRDWVRFGLLVRAQTVANPGGGQATAEQALYILDWADRMARELGLTICADLTRRDFKDAAGPAATGAEA
jgi:hypothetical protein